MRIRLAARVLLALTAGLGYVSDSKADEIPSNVGLGQPSYPRTFATQTNYLQADGLPECSTAALPAPGCAPIAIQTMSPYAGTLCERSVLTGNWMGARDQLLANGVTFDISSTNFYQGVASGGINQNFQYSGRDDIYLNVNSEKAGLWKGGFLTLHAESRYGSSVDGSTGALMPVNTGELFPLPSGSVTALTAVKASQFLSENLMVFGGKINMLDEFKQPYSARGVDAFMNLNLVLPIALARTVPYSTLGAGFAVLSDMQPVFVFSVLDTHNTPTTSGFESFLTNGVTMLAMANVPVTFLDLPGHQGGGVSYSTGSYNDLNPTAYFDPNFGPGVSFGTTQGSWSAFYMADQAFYVDPTNPRRSWGLFKTFGIADNGPSPIRWSVGFGLGGSSPINSRPLDTFGVGYSYVGYSTPVQDIAPHVVPINSDQAVELFYNVAVTPWFRLTPDLQVLFPARERTLPPGARAIDTALVLGLRAKIDF